MAKVNLSFKSILKYPLATWIFIEIAALLLGFTQYVSGTIDITVGTTSLYLAILFGLWIGKRTCDAFKQMTWVSMINAFILTLIVGFVNLMFLLLLSYYSQNFMSAVGGDPSTLISVVINAGVVTWIKMVALAIVAAAVGHEFSKK